MSTLHRPTGHTRPSSPSPTRKVLLACGILSSLLWPASSEVLAATLYKSYSSFSQTVSELTSVGAPTRPPLLVEGLIWTVLTIAFGVGVWQSAQGNRALRVTGALLVAYGAVAPLWYPFPMTARGDIQATTALTDVMHITLGAVDTLIILSILGFGAAALGKGFRLYSLVTLATVVVFGVVTFAYVPRVAAMEPTPWLGVFERIQLGAFLVWVVVLAVSLLRAGTRTGHAAPLNA